MVAAGAFAEEDGRDVTREGDIAGRGRCQGTEEYGGRKESGNQHGQPYFDHTLFAHTRLNGSRHLLHKPFTSTHGPGIVSLSDGMFKARKIYEQHTRTQVDQPRSIDSLGSGSGNSINLSGAGRRRIGMVSIAD